MIFIYNHFLAKKTKMKKILVTGGAGFLGSHLCDALLKKNHSVLCVDNFYTGTKKNIEKLLLNPNFKLIEHDITYPIYYEVDEIYNLACPASPIHYQNNPVQTTKTNVFGAINILDLANKLKVKVLQASTSEVYGDPEIHPQPESYNGKVNPIGIRACYDEGKRCAETLFFDYFRQEKLSIKVVRIFNTYGPNMHHQDGRVVSNFIMQALENKNITIFGDGTQTRSFCYVDDLIKGLISMMETNKSVTGPINLGNPNEFTMNQLAREVIRITNSKSKIAYKELPQDDPRKRQPDITLAKSELNWEPTIELEEGLKKTIDYFKTN